MNNQQSPAEPAILHVDMDAFYASIEQRDNPVYRDKPVIVGGLGRRGVVSAASYEARKFGVHSALPMMRARRLCPEGCYVRPRIGHYADVSRQVFRIFREVTPLVEGLSLDEAFLDVGGSRQLLGEIETIGRLIKDRIRDELKLVASVGMAHNKFLAKLASDFDKPDGFHHVLPGEVRRFLDPMPIRRMWGIGPKTAVPLNKLGILTIGQLRKTAAERLQPVLGNRTEHFLALSRGEDERQVIPERPDKSISNEVTFDIDLISIRLLKARLLQLSESVGRRLRKSRLAGRTITVKIRDRRFQTFNRSRTLRAATASSKEIYQTAQALFDKWRSSHQSSPVRLLGVGVSNLEDDPDQPNKPGQVLDNALDKINQRFGGETVHRGLAENPKEQKP